MELFAKPEISSGLIGQISLFLGGPLCAPVFVAVMGYFLAGSNKSLSYYFKRGCYLFFGGLLLNIGLNFHLLYHTIFTNYNFNPFIYIFGADILQLVGMSVFIIGLLRLLFKNNILLYFILALLIAGVAPYLPLFGNVNSFTSYINAFLWGNFSWSYFPLFPWFAYVLVGFSLRLCVDKYNLYALFTRLEWSLMAIPFLVISGFTISYAVGVSHKLQAVDGYYHHGILFFIWIIIALIGYVIVCSIFENYFSKNIVLRYLKWIGENVTSIYVFQWLIIGNIATEIYQTQYEMQLTLWFFMVLATASLLAYSWKKLLTKLRCHFRIYFKKHIEIPQ